MAKLFLKLCLTIHDQAEDMSEEIKGVSEHVRATAETILRKSKTDGFDLRGNK